MFPNPILCKRYDSLCFELLRVAILANYPYLCNEVFSHPRRPFVLTYKYGNGYDFITIRGSLPIYQGEKTELEYGFHFDLRSIRRDDFSDDALKAAAKFLERLYDQFSEGASAEREYQLAWKANRPINDEPNNSPQ